MRTAGKDWLSNLVLRAADNEEECMLVYGPMRY